MLQLPQLAEWKKDASHHHSASVERERGGGIFGMATVAKDASAAPAVVPETVERANPGRGGGGIFRGLVSSAVQGTATERRVHPVEVMSAVEVSTTPGAHAWLSLAPLQPAALPTSSSFNVHLHSLHTR